LGTPTKVITRVGQDALASQEFFSGDHSEMLSARAFPRKVHTTTGFAAYGVPLLLLLPAGGIQEYETKRPRGQAITAMNTRLFRTLAQAPESKLIEIYEHYLRERNASYFSIEATAGEGRRENQELYSEFSGYERIALLVLQALQAETPSLIPLTARNGRALEDLDPDDAVELPCQVSSRGVQVAAVGRAPEAVRPLLRQVKEYERLAVRASVEHSREMALAALEKNPLVGTREVAEQVLAEYLRAFGQQMKLQAA
jgi:alpha-galactosidase/6-phospho-beta-glucosidase family protein